MRELNNKLIAEFWGMELGDDKTMYYDDAENLHPPTPINELKFHSSWDWLMPVIQKIGDDILNTPFDETYSKLTEGYENIWTKEDTYLAVVEFIKWYNNQSK